MEDFNMIQGDVLVNALEPRRPCTSPVVLLSTIVGVLQPPTTCRCRYTAGLHMHTIVSSSWL